MPLPSYLICSMSGSEDSKTEQMSVFHIHELIKVEPTAKADKSTRKSARHSLPTQVTASWILLPAEHTGEEYEFQISILIPGADVEAPFVIDEGRFSFSKRSHRIVSRGSLKHFPTLGVLWFTAGLRKVGTELWEETRCPVLIIDEQSPTID